MRYAPSMLWFAWFFLLGLVIPSKIEAQGAAKDTASNGAASAAQANNEDADEVWASHKWERQMVWITYSEGDVKLSPGKKGETKLGKDWIEANPGQVLEDGYSLVTATGRAEIEFEDGTVVYLADHSVLEFDSLWVKGADVSTELSLLTGMATLSYPGNLPGVFQGEGDVSLYTPVARIRFTEKSLVRVQAALDGSRMKELEGAHAFPSPNPNTDMYGLATLDTGEEAAIAKGRRLVFLDPRKPGEDVEELEGLGKSVRPPETAEEKTAEAWDAWAMARQAKREGLIAEGLKESGMAKPIPGLVGMVENGRFFDCAQYGKCWQPNPVSSAAQSAVAGQAAHGPQQQGTPQDAQGSATGADRTGAVGTQILVNQTMASRCPMETWQVTRDAQGKQHANLVQYGPCFAGSWNYPYEASVDPCASQANLWGYASANCPAYYNYPVWVPGRRHHQECHWVKGHGHQVGFVPRNPLDKAGHPPVNAKAGFFVLSTDKGRVAAGVMPASSREVQAARPPTGVERGIAKAGLESVVRVSQPEIQARMASEILPAEMASANAKRAGTGPVSTVRFDYKSGNFVGKTGGVVGGGEGHSVVVAHGGGAGGLSGGGSHGGSGGGAGAHGGGGGGGANAGGGGHSGGGGSAGGGGGGGHH